MNAGYVMFFSLFVSVLSLFFLVAKTEKVQLIGLFISIGSLLVYAAAMFIGFWPE